jgi:uncharacterized membrane-anchored protein YjiN (DUF445 family)
MTSARYLGPVSLSICVTGMVASEALIQTGILANPWWQIMSMGFEAGTIGGIADWFAVSALFREVPIPILSRHTNIICKNRTKITDNIVDMVQTKWLSPQIIGEKLATFSFSQAVIDYLDAENHRQQLMELARDLLRRLNEQTDDPHIATFLAAAIQDQLLDAELGAPLGKWIQSAMVRGDHHSIWDGLLASLEKSLSSDEMRETARNLLTKVVEEQAPQICEHLTQPSTLASIEEGIKRWLLRADLARNMGKWLKDAVNRDQHQPLMDALSKKLGSHLISDAVEEQVDQMVRGALTKYKVNHSIKGFFIGDDDIISTNTAIMDELGRFAADISINKLHPIRRELDKVFIEFASNLIDDRTTQNQFDSLRNILVDEADFGPLVNSIIIFLRDALIDGAKGRGGVSIIDFDQISEMILGAGCAIVEDIKKDADHPIRAKLDAVIFDLANSLANGDESAVNMIFDLQNSLVKNADFSQMINKLLSRFKQSIDMQLKDHDSDLSNLISKFIFGTVSDLKVDPEYRNKLDIWVSATIISLVDKHHDMIGDMVRTSLSPAKISNNELVAQIEEKIGDDLQYIRLNGALVGGMVGSIIMAIKMVSFGH